MKVAKWHEENLGTVTGESRTVTRCVSLPVKACLSGEWPEFMTLLRACWRQSTDLANWASQQLARHDVTRTPGMPCLPKYETLDLYALAFGRDKIKKARTPGKADLPAVAAQYDGGGFWAGGKIAAATLLRGVQAKHVRERGKVIWRRERRTAEYQYPTPFPVPAQSWVSFLGERGEPCVALSLPGGRVTLSLRGGPEFAWHLAVFRRLAQGELKQMELKICRQRSYSPHRREGAERLPGGGHRESYRIMLRLAVRVEIPAGPGAKGVAEATTGGDPFVSLLTPGGDPWLLHAPWVPMWIKEHRRFLDTFADDLKFDKRWPGNKRRGLNRYRERRCDKHSRRMKSFVQEVAAQVVGYASRRGCGRLVWVDSDRSFAAEFAWFSLRERLQQKCDEEGLVFAPVASGEAVDAGDASPDGVSDP